MPLLSIIGHKKQRLQLEQDLATGNLAHAYLFAGPKHIGKLAMAHWFAREILKKDSDPSTHEALLKRMHKLTHPDLLVLDQLWMEDTSDDWEEIAKSSNLPQQQRAKAKLKTNSIGIDDIREIQHRLHESGDLPHRICIISEIERMQPAAANALLKILEEPPAGRIFLLTTHSQNSLLPTITSRSRVLRFERIADKDIQEILFKMDTEADKAFITHIAQGAPGIALTLMNDPEALRKERTLHEHALSFWRQTSVHARLQELKPLEKRGDEAERFLFHLALALWSFPEWTPAQEQALNRLTEGLRTNAYRPLQIQAFAYSL